MSNLRAYEIFRDSKRMLIAIESVSYRHGKTTMGCHLYGNIEPIAVIVCHPDGIYALDMELEFKQLDQLRQDIPGLDAMLASFNQTLTGSGL